MADSAKAFERIRKLIATWPETEERLSHNSPTFWGGKKTFCNFVDDRHSYGHHAVWFKATLDVQAALVERDPKRCFVPKYVGHRGWVGYRVDGKIEWPLLEEMLEEAYRSVAPKRALKLMDER